MELRRYQQWDAARIRQWAERIGASTLVVINRIFESVAIDEQGVNPALAVLRLSRRSTADRVEAACRITLAGPVRSPRYAHVQPLLATGQDQDQTRPDRTGRARRLRPRCLLLCRRDSVTSIDTETKRKLREMGAMALLEALEAQDEDLTMGMSFDERLRLVVDEAHSVFNHAKIEENSSAGPGCATRQPTCVNSIGSMNAAWIGT